MKVIIVGCGRIGASLASQLYRNNHQVTVIDQEASAFDNLPIDFHGRTIKGDILAQNTLQRAEISSADALAAVTRSDSLNALVAHIAQTEYGITRLVARNYDPRQRHLQEAFDIPVIGSAGWGVQLIEELLSEGPLHPIMLDGNAHFAVYRLDVPEKWEGKLLQELLPTDAKLLSWTRSSKNVPTTAGQSVQAGDLIYLSSNHLEIDKLRQSLNLALESDL